MFNLIIKFPEIIQYQKQDNIDGIRLFYHIEMIFEFVCICILRAFILNS